MGKWRGGLVIQKYNNLDHTCFFFFIKKVEKVNSWMNYVTKFLIPHDIKKKKKKDFRVALVSIKSNVIVIRSIQEAQDTIHVFQFFLFIIP